LIVDALIKLLSLRFKFFQVALPAVGGQLNISALCWGRCGTRAARAWFLGRFRFGRVLVGSNSQLLKYMGGGYHKKLCGAHSKG
jgi:hypothetical protein